MSELSLYLFYGTVSMLSTKLSHELDSSTSMEVDLFHYIMADIMKLKKLKIVYSLGR